MSEQTPPLTGFYQLNTLAADFGYWAKMPNWSNQEAAALFLGCNPDKLAASFERSYGEASRVARPYESLLELAERSVETRWTDLSPREWIEWAKSRDIPIPTPLDAAVARYEGLAAPGKSAESTRIADLESELATLKALLAEMPKAIGTRERDSMLKLIIGMAVAGYTYDPKANRGSAVPDIVADLAKHGVALSDETVRQYLKKAAELLPPPP